MDKFPMKSPVSDKDFFFFFSFMNVCVCSLVELPQNTRTELKDLIPTSNSVIQKKNW